MEFATNSISGKMGSSLVRLQLESIGSSALRFNLMIVDRVGFYQPFGMASG